MMTTTDRKPDLRVNEDKTNVRVMPRNESVIIASISRKVRAIELCAGSRTRAKFVGNITMEP